MTGDDSEVEQKEIDGIPLDWWVEDKKISLACPVCGDCYSHIRCVHTALGVDPNEGGRAYKGTVAKGAVGYRRDCLVITIDGECGHAWEIRIQQNKGNNFVSTRAVEPIKLPDLP